VPSLRFLHLDSAPTLDLMWSYVLEMKIIPWRCSVEELFDRMTPALLALRSEVIVQTDPDNVRAKIDTMAEGLGDDQKPRTQNAGGR
jgi:hypothetical protein